MAERRMLRKIAEQESELPFSFNYKIRQAFFGRKCPICGIEMKPQEFQYNQFLPSIQHNKPITKGGKHELGNISVICKRCNVTLQDKETGKLNADEVAFEWNKCKEKG